VIIDVLSDTAGCNAHSSRSRSRSLLSASVKLSRSLTHTFHTLPNQSSLTAMKQNEFQSLVSQSHDSSGEQLILWSYAAQQ